jgi:antitoxin ParD1/3/4
MNKRFTLGAEFEKIIDDQVARGRYGSADDVMRAALLLLEAQDREIESGWTAEELRREIRKGMESGSGTPAEGVFDRLERKYLRAARQPAEK